MIDLSKYSYDSILNSMLEKVPNTIDKRPGSFIRTALAPIASIIFSGYFTMDIIQKYTFVSFAPSTFLDYRAAERGLSRKQATPAVRRVYFNIEIPQGTRFSTINGSSSVNFTVGDFIKKIDDYYYYQASCETLGIIGNGYTGPLQSITYINGLNVAQMDEILIPGAEIEDDESLRERYYDSLREKAFGGNIAAYREEILKMDGVGAVQVWPFWKGGGTVLCTILTTEFALASKQLIEKVQINICPPIEDETRPSELGVGFAPIGASVTIATATEYKVNISFNVLIKVEAVYETVVEKCRASIEDYLLGLRKKWDEKTINKDIIYKCNILYAQVLAALIGSEGVLNITGLLINGNNTDIYLTQSREMQELPFLGEFNVTQITN